MQESGKFVYPVRSSLEIVKHILQHTESTQLSMLVLCAGVKETGG